MTETDDRQDAELIARVAAGDRTAIQALFARHNLALFRFLNCMLRNQAVAEELVNETYMEIWRSAGKFEGRSRVSSWMFGIARNKALSVMRKRSDSPLDDGFASQIEDGADTPELSALKKSKAEAIKICLQKLSADHREVVDLVYYHEKTINEVSEIVGIPANTVKTRMFHARKQLSGLMESAGIDRGWP